MQLHTYCIYIYVCICEGVSIFVSVPNPASSVLMAELRG